MLCLSAESRNYDKNLECIPVLVMHRCVSFELKLGNVLKIFEPNIAIMS